MSPVAPRKQVCACCLGLFPLIINVARRKIGLPPSLDYICVCIGHLSASQNRLCCTEVSSYFYFSVFSLSATERHVASRRTIERHYRCAQCLEYISHPCQACPHPLSTSIKPVIKRDKNMWWMHGRSFLDEESNCLVYPNFVFHPLLVWAKF